MLDKETYAYLFENKIKLKTQIYLCLRKYYFKKNVGDKEENN